MYPNQPGQDPYQPPAQPAQPYQPPVQPQPQPNGQYRQVQQPQQPQPYYPPVYTQGQPIVSQPYPQPQAETPLDYLNQIAPKQPVKQPLFKGIRGVILIGLILVVVVSILALVINIATSGQSSPAQQLALRLSSNQKIADAAQTDLKSSELRGLNSNLRLFFTNTNRDIATPLLAVNVKVKQIDPALTATEKARSERVSTRLENGRLNAIYDRTYAREMAYELATLLSLMKQVYNQTNDPQLRKFLSTTSENLVPTQEAFENYNDGI